MLFPLEDLSSSRAEKKPVSQKVAVTGRQYRTAQGNRPDKVGEVIGQVAMGQSVHYVSAGEWSMHDLLLHLIDQTGPAEVWAASWSITEDPCRQLVKALDDGRITALNLLFDWRVKVRCPEAYHLARHNAAKVHLSSCHAKVTVLINEQWAVAVVGSANYTNNPRIECGIIVCDRQVAQFHRDWIASALTQADPFEMQRGKR